MGTNERSMKRLHGIHLVAILEYAFMRFSLAFLLLVMLIGIPHPSQLLARTLLTANAPHIPLPPDTSHTEGHTADLVPAFSAVAPSGPAYPLRLKIPSIKLNAPVERVGINAKGEMDVPDGRSKNVGWYAYGTLPGDMGSAVMDAHVYAAFKKLKNVKVGQEVVVEGENGTVLRFVVREATVYALADVPAQRLFADSSGKYLNLITCAGKYVRSLGTYSHRLIVYAELVE